MKKKKVIQILDGLNDSLSSEPFEDQNLDAIMAFKMFGVEVAADNDSLAMAKEKEFNGIRTRYGRWVYEQLCKAYGVKNPYAVQEIVGGWAQRPIEFKSYDSAYDYAGHQSGCIEILPSLAVEIDYL